VLHQIGQRDANNKYSFLALGGKGRLVSSRIGCYRESEWEDPYNKNQQDAVFIFNLFQ